MKLKTRFRKFLSHPTRKHIRPILQFRR